jgi:hypothetical protein
VSAIQDRIDCPPAADVLGALKFNLARLLAQQHDVLAMHATARHTSKAHRNRDSTAYLPEIVELEDLIQSAREEIAALNRIA